MMDFVKVILLVALFYVLIIFSFLWFNKKERNIQSVPYIKSFLEVIVDSSRFWQQEPIKIFDFNKIFPREDNDNDIDIFLPEPRDD